MEVEEAKEINNIDQVVLLSLITSVLGVLISGLAKINVYVGVYARYKDEIDIYYAP